jgi:hypothetical protein
MYEAVLRQILTDAPNPAEDHMTAAAIAIRAMSPQLDMLSHAEQQLLAEWLDEPSPGRSGSRSSVGRGFAPS